MYVSFFYVCSLLTHSGDATFLKKTMLMYSEKLFLFNFFQSKDLKRLRDLVWARFRIRSPVGMFGSVKMQVNVMATIEKNMQKWLFVLFG